jgi:predicted transcriptional regulator
MQQYLLSLQSLYRNQEDVDIWAIPATPKRESVDIISEILSFVADGVTAKTHLMQRSNLDSRAMKSYMAVMTEKGLLSSERNGSHESYHLTEKGKDFLQTYNTLEGYLD